MKLAVHLVSWNGSKYVPYLFDSLRRQIFKDWKLYILDNGSSDGMVDMMKLEMIDFPVEWELIENTENTGFVGGHNSLMNKTNSEYVLLLNQDMYIKDDCLEKLVDFLDKHEDVASVAPRLMRWNFEKLDFEVLKSDFQDKLKNSFTGQIDALGLKIFRSRRVIEQYTGQDWSKIENDFDNMALPVFGVSGAFPMLRRSAVKDVLFKNGDFFDEYYHSYKEDVDLAFRLVSAGYESYILLNTIAYHDRSASGPRELGDLDALKNKRKQSQFIKLNSYKNHLITVYKNESWQNFLLDFPWIIWYELKKLIYFLLFDIEVLKGLTEIWRLRKEIKVKRKEIWRLRKVGWREIRKWWRS